MLSNRCKTLQLFDKWREHFPAVPGGTSSITSGQFLKKNVTLNYLTAQNVLEKCPIFISLRIKGKILNAGVCL